MKDKKILRIAEIAAAALLLTFIWLFLFSTRQDLFSSRRMEDYSKGWVYRCGEEKGEGLKSADAPVPRNTEVEFENVLPGDVPEGSGIVFRTRMQEVRVYVDGQQVYQFPEKDLIGGELTSVWNFVRLGEADAGKEIRIVVSSPYRWYGGVIGKIFYGDLDDMVTEIISVQTKYSRASSLIGMSGVIIILISLLGRRYRLYAWHRRLGILLLCLAFWLAGESGLPSGVVGLEAWHYFSRLSVLFFPVFLAAYLYDRWPDVWGKITRGMFYGTFLYAAAVLIAKLLGGPDLTALEPVTGVVACASVLCAIGVHIAVMKRKKEDYIGSELVCLLIAVAVTVADLAGIYGSAEQIGFVARLAILLYAVNMLRFIFTEFLKKVKENKELTQSLQRSRAELMASQIKPHFIYNTLNSIRTLIKVDPETAQQTVYDFSTYLRSNLDNVGERELIPFSDELRHIEAYLNIERIRFEERLRVVTDIRARSFLVPPLSVQLLVENAVKHGVCARMEGGTVTIKSYEEEDAYVIEVSDDGVGFDVESLEKKSVWHREKNGYSHIGLENIRFRIREITDGTLEIKSRPGEGTKVTVTLPKVSEIKGKGIPDEKGRKDTCVS